MPLSPGLNEVLDSSLLTLRVSSLGEAKGIFSSMGLLYYVSYLAVLAAFAFVTLSLASGLLYVSELIEEHSRLAKQVGQRGILAIIMLHLVFYFTDSFPLSQTMFSITCHIVYLQNFSHTWPLISLSSPTFLASCTLVIADHFVWFFYFSRLTHEAKYSRGYRGGGSTIPGFTEIASFFGICVWLAPLFLFLSLSANDNALPTSAADPNSSMPANSSPARVSLFRSIFSFLSFGPLSKSKSSQQGNGGIIAPRSPITTQPLLHSQYPPPSSPLAPHVRPRSPPRSPVHPHSVVNSSQEVEVQIPAASQNFRLHAPPMARRRPTGDAYGPGVLRPTQPSKGVFH